MTGFEITKDRKSILKPSSGPQTKTVATLSNGKQCTQNSVVVDPVPCELQTSVYSSEYSGISGKSVAFSCNGTDRSNPEQRSSVCSRASQVTMTQMFSYTKTQGGTVEYHIDKDILRGVPLFRTLKKMGRVWRISPCDLPPTELNKLWDSNCECSGIDYFLSHSWSAPGWQKYIALSLRFRSIHGIVCGTIAMGLCFVLIICHILPASGTTSPSSVGDWRASKPLYVWCGIFGPLVGVLAVFLSASFPDPFRTEPLVFLDVMCIHQVDMEKKERGIYSLGGFLGHSRKLLVLWSPQYLTRLWCVFELAAFCNVKRHGPHDGYIEFLPSGPSVGAVILFLMLTGVMISYRVLFDLFFAYSGWVSRMLLSFAMGVVWGIPCSATFNFVRKNMQKQRFL